MYKCYWRSRRTALLAVILLSSFACTSLKAAANSGLDEKLLAAARAGNLGVVTRLVELGADTRSSRAQVINAADKNGMTLLQLQHVGPWSQDFGKTLLSNR